eukprot:scaffold101558_cov17-Prasinocladus_malaysianus.AAC.1
MAGRGNRTLVFPSLRFSIIGRADFQLLAWNAPCSLVTCCPIVLTIYCSLPIASKVSGGNK